MSNWTVYYINDRGGDIITETFTATDSKAARRAALLFAVDHGHTSWRVLEVRPLV